MLAEVKKSVKMIRPGKASVQELRYGIKVMCNKSVARDKLNSKEFKRKIQNSI